MKNPNRYGWDGRSDKHKVCDQCGSDAEVKYTNLEYGYLCVECYHDWAEAEDEMRGVKR
jgi:uncharacterized Zn ribbon protein